MIEGDELISIKRLSSETNDEEDGEGSGNAVFPEEADILLGTSRGWIIRFPVSQLRTLGRTARGVRGVTLHDDKDKVIGLSIVTNEKTNLLFVTENGYGKRTKLGEFRPQNRAGKGLMAFKPDKRNGAMVSFIPVKEKDELITISEQGLVIRAKIAQIPIQKRYALGVTIIRLLPKDKVVNVAIVAKEQK